MAAAIQNNYTLDQIRDPFILPELPKLVISQAKKGDQQQQNNQDNQEDKPKQNSQESDIQKQMNDEVQQQLFIKKQSSSIEKPQRNDEIERSEEYINQQFSEIKLENRNSKISNNQDKAEIRENNEVIDQQFSEILLKNQSSIDSQSEDVEKILKKNSSSRLQEDLKGLQNSPKKKIKSHPANSEKNPDEERLRKGNIQAQKNPNLIQEIVDIQLDQGEDEDSQLQDLDVEERKVDWVANNEPSGKLLNWNGSKERDEKKVLGVLEHYKELNFQNNKKPQPQKQDRFQEQEESVIDLNPESLMKYSPKNKSNVRNVEEIESESGDEVYMDSPAEKRPPKMSEEIFMEEQDRKNHHENDRNHHNQNHGNGNLKFNQSQLKQLKSSTILAPELPGNMDLEKLNYNASVQANKLIQNIKQQGVMEMIDENQENTLQIRIEKYEEKKDGFFSKSYVSYTIITTNQAGVQYQVSRRFSDFVRLREYLQEHKNFQNITIPVLPDKEGVLGLLWSDQKFLQERKMDLEIFLQSCSQEPLIAEDSAFKEFYSVQSEEFKLPDMKNLLEIGAEVMMGIMGMSFQDLKEASYALWAQKYQEYIRQIDFDLGMIPVYINSINESASLVTQFNSYIKSQVANLISLKEKLDLRHQQQKQLDQTEQKAVLEGIRVFVGELNGPQSLESILKSYQTIQITFKKIISKISTLQAQYQKLISMLNNLEYYKNLKQQKLINRRNLANEQLHRLEDQIKTDEENIEQLKCNLQDELSKFQDKVKELIYQSFLKLRQVELLRYP